MACACRKNKKQSVGDRLGSSNSQNKSYLLTLPDGTTKVFNTRAQAMTEQIKSGGKIQTI